MIPFHRGSEDLGNSWFGYCSRQEQLVFGAVVIGLDRVARQRARYSPLFFRVRVAVRDRGKCHARDGQQIPGKESIHAFDGVEANVLLL